jgi:hypothetical protein
MFPDTGKNAETRLECPLWGLLIPQVECFHGNTLLIEDHGGGMEGKGILLGHHL